MQHDWRPCAVFVNNTYDGFVSQDETADKVDCGNEDSEVLSSWHITDGVSVIIFKPKARTNHCHFAIMNVNLCSSV